MDTRSGSARSGRYVHAALRPGTRLLAASGDLLTVTGTRVYEQDLVANNLTIDDLHTYFAGTTPVLVHDSNCIFGWRGSPIDATRNHSPTSIGGRECSGDALDQMQGRGFVPSVVENVIQHGSATASRGGTVVHEFESTKVVVSSVGKVVTVIG